MINVVVPSSHRPLGFVDETDPPITSYSCLNTLNATWGYLNIYKPFNRSGDLHDGIYVVAFPDSVDLDTVVAAYLASGCFDDVHRMPCYQPHGVPDDPLYLNGADTVHRQWALDATHMRVQEAWDITTGSPSAVVAIIDEAFTFDHPDLRDNLWINDGEDLNHDGKFECWSSSKDSNGVYGDSDGVDNDGNGYADDVVGLKFTATKDAFETSPNVGGGSSDYHGTIAASVISARTDNALGMAGVAGGWGNTPGIKLMLLAAPGLSGAGTEEAVRYAIRNGADIMSMSWGARVGRDATYAHFRRLDSLLAAAYFDSSIICVASAGNFGETDSMVPAVFGEIGFDDADGECALYDSNRVIAVGSLERDNTRCSYSNYGRYYIDVAAPGYTWGAMPPADSFGYWFYPLAATSWSAPMVAGVAGLVKSAYPGLDKVGVIARMHDGCSPTAGSETPKPFRWGNIDALKALSKGPKSPWHDEVQLWEDFIVAPGETLIVNSGTTVFTPNPPTDYTCSGVDQGRAEIMVYGTLIAQGQGGNPIIFEGQGDESEGYSDWGGIIVRDGGKVVLDGVTIRNATTAVRIDSTVACSLHAVNISRCQSAGVEVGSKNVSIQGCQIHDIADGYGITGMGAGANVYLYACTLYQCPVGVALDGDSGGCIWRSVIGDGTSNAGDIGISLNCAADVWQTLVDGSFDSAAVSVSGSAPTIRECILNGRGTGHYGLYAMEGSSPVLRCTQVIGQSLVGVYGYKADMDLGRNVSGQYGNNFFDSVPEYAIRSEAHAVTAEKNYFTSPPSERTFGEIDYDPWLSSQPSCVGTVGGGDNKPTVVNLVPKFFANQNFPNPFNAGTTIRFALSEGGPVRLEVFDILGRHVCTLLDEIKAQGSHQVTWDATDSHGAAVASGMYFYRLTTPSQVESKTMVLLK